MSWSVAAVLSALLSVPIGAQFTVPPAADVLLTGQFRSSLTYETALERLDAYYQEQIGRRGSVALPRVAPRVHFEVWHDMWIFFEPAGAGIAVTIKRSGDAVTTQLSKGWMVELAGRMQGELPVTFQEMPPLRSVESDIFALKSDVVRALQSQPSMAAVPTWEHAGLMISPSPLASVVLAFGGAWGMHRVTVTTESSAASRQLLAKLIAEAAKPGIRGAFSEATELNAEIGRASVERAKEIGATATQGLFAGQIDPKLIEDQMRGDPETRKRLQSTDGYYDVRYRVDKAYAKVNVLWSELAGYNREDGKFQEEQQRGQSSVTAPRITLRVPPLTARTKLAGMKPGAYRIRIEGVLAGRKIQVDQRDFWFDGKTFEEL